MNPIVVRNVPADINTTGITGQQRSGRAQRAELDQVTRTILVALVADWWVLLASSRAW